MLDVPVKDLSLKELQDLKVHHPSEKKGGVKEFNSDGLKEHEPFPTLQTVLCELDDSCGFNIEIKYPQMMKDGSEESSSPMELNLFLDCVLSCVLRHCNQRKIVFSSFSADVCSMLVAKQNRFPVLFLTQGETEKYEPYKDPRTHSIKQGAWFAQMAGLLGLSAMAGVVMANPSLVSYIKQRNQVIFCWTDEQNDRETVKFLKNLKVNGVIYDRMDQNKEKDANESIFFSPEKKFVSSISSGFLSDCSDPPSPQKQPPSPSFVGMFQPS